MAQKIVYRTLNGNLWTWRKVFVDDIVYQLEPDEVFGDYFKKPLLDNGVVIDGWTQQDTGNETQAQIDSDPHSIASKKELRDGQTVYWKIRALIKRRVSDGTITSIQGKGFRRNLSTIIPLLRNGEIDLAKDDLDAMTPANQDVLGVLNEIRTLVNNIII